MRTGPPMQTVFLSDVHLEPSRPDISARFFSYLNRLDSHTERLFIVGDLFDAWIGDDAPGPVGQQTIEHLARLSDSGVRGFFMHGNRDFLIGERFAQQTGFALLPEEQIIDCYGTRVLLMHGDSLCTDDIAYQALRKVVRDAEWQANILSMSVDQRLAMATEMRQQSAAQMSQKSEEIMDVNQQTVEEAMQQHDANLLLHGHTHRPCVHELVVNGKKAQRIVLGDWYEQGSVVTWDDRGFALTTLDHAAQAG